MELEFVGVRNKIYNAVVEGLGLSRDSFQLIQAAPPLVQGNDHMLWDYLDNIPPLSLDQRYTPSGGNQFTSAYKAAMQAMLPSSTIDFIRDIGEQTFHEFIAYLKELRPTPRPNQYSDIFFNWALLNAPSVADLGASDYAAQALDVLRSAQSALLLYAPTGAPNPSPGLPYDWGLGYNDLVAQLQRAPSGSFTVSSQHTDSGVNNTWANGHHTAALGLLKGTDGSSHIDSHFAQSTFKIEASFRHVLRFQANAGAWYTSAALGLAYSNPASPPWRPGATQWANVFGDQGILPRVTANILVVDTMSISVTADTRYGTNEADAMRHSSSGGFAPIYAAENGNGVTNDVQVDNVGRTTLTSRSAPGVPIVLGCDVLPISRFLGHAVAAAKLAIPAAAV